MQRITTPTRVLNLFGAGKDGLTDTPPNQTQLDAAWFNNIQEEISNAIEDQGIVLDGSFGQLTTALNSWAWSGTPTVQAGAELVLETGAPGGKIRCESGAEIRVESGADLVTDTGSAAIFNGTVLVGGLGSFTVNCNADFMNDVTLGDVPGDSIICNGTVSCNAPLLILGASGGSLSTDPSAVCQFNGEVQLVGRTRILQTISTAQGDISRDSNYNLQWRDAVATKKVHVSPSGRVKGYGHANTLVPAAATISLDTNTAVAPLVAADLDVSAQIMVQRAVAGNVIVSLNEVGGIGQISTSQTINVTATGGTSYTAIVFSRTRVAADTTPRVYRLTVDGNGSNVLAVSARINVEEAS
jgi:hypothetical protein